MILRVSSDVGTVLTDAHGAMMRNARVTPPAAHRQVKGSNGRYISVEFEPKHPDVFTTSAGSVERRLR
jgi:hypothetical protein